MNVRCMLPEPSVEQLDKIASKTFPFLTIYLKRTFITQSIAYLFCLFLTSIFNLFTTLINQKAIEACPTI